MRKIEILTSIDDEIVIDDLIAAAELKSVKKESMFGGEAALVLYGSLGKEISRNYQSISEYFKTPFEASIYFMGHDIKKTYGTNFMQNDATLFLRDEEAKCYIADLCKLKEPFFSEEQKSRAKEIMDTPIY